VRLEGVDVVLPMNMGHRGKSLANRGSGWHALPLAAVAAALSLLLGACLEDVPLPPCVAVHKCKSLGEAGAGGSADDAFGPTQMAGDGGVGGRGDAGGAGDVSSSGSPDRNGIVPVGDRLEPSSLCRKCLISPVALAPGCVGRKYAATLMFQGGTAPYSWQVTEGPEGWSVAASTDNQAILHGDEVLEEGATVTVKVTDRHGLSTTQTLRLEVRTNCWFAVTTSADSSGELWLFDPLARHGKRAQLTHQSDAYDFGFSPDGNWLAYRHAADATAPHGGTLTLVDLTTMAERELHFGVEGSVTSYAWSPSSEVLAAAFVDGTQPSLGAVRVPTVGSTDSPTSLGITPANVESPLTWVDERYVVFHGLKTPPAWRAVYYALLDSTGFQPPKEAFAPALAPVTIAPKSQGFFVIAPDQVSFNSLQDDAYAFYDHPWKSLVSPSGRTTALVNGDQLLEVYAATNGFTPITSRTGVTCPLLLASSPGTERVACVADVPLVGGGVRGEVRFFDVDGSDDLPVRVLDGYCEEDVGDTSDDSCLSHQTGYSYGEAQAVGNARAFSGSGRYFAFARAVADNTYVYWADLQEASPRIVGSVVLTKWDETLPVSVLRFSPDERFLFVQRGARLAMAEVLTGASTLVSANVTTAPPCSEELDNPAFCGNPDGSSTMKFSVNSQALAMRASQGVSIFDLSPFPETLYSYRFSAAPCGDTCVGDLAFQP
jgi:WD40 repeat protein